MNGVTPKMIRASSRKQLKSLKDRKHAYTKDLKGIETKHTENVANLKKQRSHNKITKV